MAPPAWPPAADDIVYIVDKIIPIIPVSHFAVSRFTSGIIRIIRIRVLILH